MSQATQPMTCPVAATDEELGVVHVDAAFRWAAVVVRAGIYAFLYAFADSFDCGRVLMTGGLVGDAIGQFGGLAWQWRDGWLRATAELAWLGLLAWCMRDRLAWPTEPPLQAILALAAFGVLAGKISGAWWSRGETRAGELA